MTIQIQLTFFTLVGLYVYMVDLRFITSLLLVIRFNILDKSLKTLNSKPSKVNIRTGQWHYIRKKCHWKRNIIQKRHQIMEFKFGESIKRQNQLTHFWNSKTNISLLAKKNC